VTLDRSKPRTRKLKVNDERVDVDEIKETHDLTGVPLPSASGGEDEMVFYTNDPTGAMEATNQLVVSGFEVSQESADERQYLANHLMRLSFEEHLVNQRGESHHQLVVAMQKQLAEDMLRLEGARQHKLQMIENTRKAHEASRKNREARKENDAL